MDKQNLRNYGTNIKENFKLNSFDLEEIFLSERYYIKIINQNNGISIIVYKIGLLDNINKYEINMNINEICYMNKKFKLFHIREIYKIFMNCINEKNYEIIDNKSNLRLFLNSINGKISFLLNNFNNTDDKNELINVLAKTKKGLKNNDIILSNLTKTKGSNFFNKHHSVSKTIKNFSPETKEKKYYRLTCSKCPLIPEIVIENPSIPIIHSKCANNHIEKKIDIINFMKNEERLKRELKCKCKEYKSKYCYCKDCKLYFCGKCKTFHNMLHEKISEENLNYYCLEHLEILSYFCYDCKKNLCNKCKNIHASHSIKKFSNMIPSDISLDKIIKNKDKIILYLEKILEMLESYKNKWIDIIDKLKDFYNNEIKIYNEIINIYSKKKYNYQIIKNLKNLTYFSFDEDYIDKNESFYEKTEKILNILKILKKQNTLNIKLINNIEINEKVYSLCYLKKNNLIAMGSNKKIELYDSDIKFIQSYDLLDNKIAYIYELFDGKILVVDLNKNIKILEYIDNEIKLYKTIETKEERNFVGIQISNKNIICGGDTYLSIIEPSFFFKYSLKDTIDLKGFISNIVELDSNHFLVGQNHDEKIIIYSSKNNEQICTINDIYLRGNNYSISKITNEYVGISGWENSKKINGCIYILSIEKREICKKVIINDINNFMVVTKINDDYFITIGTGLDLDNYSDLILFKNNFENDKIITKKICDFKRGYCDTIEAIIAFNNYILASDSSSYLKKWKINI